MGSTMQMNGLVWKKRRNTVDAWHKVGLPHELRELWLSRSSNGYLIGHGFNWLFTHKCFATYDGWYIRAFRWNTKQAKAFWLETQKLWHPFLDFCNRYQIDPVLVCRRSEIHMRWEGRTWRRAGPVWELIQHPEELVLRLHELSQALNDFADRKRKKC
jgi:hypothetical protein